MQYVYVRKPMLQPFPSVLQVRLVFIARADIRAGQELTFDYRFKVEEGVEKVPCRCGAPNCRGSLN